MPASQTSATTSRTLALRNRQRDCRINLPALRRIVRCHLDEQLELTAYDLAVHLLGTRAMAQVNQQHLGHDGATDVITFDYNDEPGPPLHGELLVCPAVAVQQAKEFGTTWPSEMVRYIVHGILHLQGYDDLDAAKRRVMKREEDRRVAALGKAQKFSGIRQG